MSKQLTEKEVQKHIDAYYKQYLAIGTSAGPTNRAKAEEAVSAAYSHLGMNTPKYEWFVSPDEGLVRAAQLANGTDSPTNKQIRDQLSLASWGQFEAYWVAYYTLGDKEILKTNNPLIPIANGIVNYCGIFWTFEDVVVMTEKPTELHILDGRLHRTDGPAICYSNGFCGYYVDGVRYSSKLEQALATKHGN